MELLELYDRYRKKTGRVHERGKPFGDGDYHLVVHVWIQNDQGQFLIQKRQPWKKIWPDIWDCACSGAAILGDVSEGAAVREAKEELGIDLDMGTGELLFTVKFPFGFDDIWLVRQNIDRDDLKLQQEEVGDARWASQDEILDMVDRGEFINYPYLERLFELINSTLSLRKAMVKDAEVLLAMQKEVFMPLYKKYQDHETSPVNQTMDRFLRRFDIGDYYKIIYENTLVGSVFVYQKAPGVMRLHILNICQSYQNKGIAQEVMKRLESMYPEAETWELETILSEKRNCHLYEKMGYVQKEEMEVINDRLTLVTYKKQENLYHIRGM